MRSTAVVFLALATACSGVTSPSELDVLVQPQVNEIDRPPATAVIPFTVTNRSSVTVFVATCSENLQAVVERFENDQWVPFASGCTEFSLSVPAELPAGRTINGSVGVSDAGVFRIRVLVSSDVQTGFVPGKPSTGVRVR